VYAALSTAAWRKGGPEEEKRREGTPGLRASIYKGKNLLFLKYQRKQQNTTAPQTPVMARVHSNAWGTENRGTSKFMPKTPETTPKMATTNVAVVRSSSNWISWFRTLSCNSSICDDLFFVRIGGTSCNRKPRENAPMWFMAS